MNSKRTFLIKKSNFSFKIPTVKNYSALFILLLFLTSSCKKKRVGPEPEPPAKQSSYFLKVSSTLNNTMVVDQNGGLWATGKNNSKVLGGGLTETQYSFAKVMSDVKDVSIKDFRSLVLKTDNSVWTAGSNSFTELGTGNAPFDGQFKKVFEGAIAVEAGEENGFIIKSDQSLWAVGFNYRNIFGASNSNANVISSYTKIADNVLAISAGSGHVLMLKSRQHAAYRCFYSSYTSVASKGIAREGMFFN